MNRSIAARINELFDVMHPAGEPPRTNSDIAQQVASRTGASFTEEDLRLLRAGATQEAPPPATLGALAECFGVASSYLVAAGGNPDVSAQLRLLKALRDQGVRDICCSARVPADADRVGAVNALAALVEDLGWR